MKDMGLDFGNMGGGYDDPEMAALEREIYGGGKQSHC